jgi:hypothetical protein
LRAIVVELALLQFARHKRLGMLYQSLYCPLGSKTTMAVDRCVDIVVLTSI